ncbi:TonB family protein [Pseudoxanthomonas wuyuanensis]|uniref:TonB family C-terminal domain-containing protein n=1 Tax=Pseudoxanthomonas wuyuanensis TaxID=1073196 RepID=A0A286D3K5_9GAMM|nr:TonB family protein [Pseudoxanthomonas wuyuanensis]KAF1722935.1 energy transducer TonB [Pseudoxanthomonas wuyuanensis]SOD53243.1 TonB family C-terminal domain-containing protein [Pseudoxanthomonas wuyuanensis]
MSKAILHVLLETALASSAAIVLVMALRGWIGSRFGARIVYLLWALVPIAQLAVLLPARVGPAEAIPLRAQLAMAQTPVADVAAYPGYEPVLVCAWITGVLAVLALQIWQQRRFRRWLGPACRRADGLIQAGVSEGLPAVVGLLRPRIVVPADFDWRYDEQERQLVLEHERVHLRRGDLQVNAVLALLRCVYWFNPLLHLAAQRFRHDQELACDQAVIARFPQQRRGYGEAMLKTQLAARVVPLACHWNTRHSLKERIAMLKRPLPGRRRTLAGKSVALLLILTAAAIAWAAQPSRLPSGTGQGVLQTAQDPAGSGAPILSVASLQTAVADGATPAPHLPPPHYPADAARQGISGSVLLRILVGADGKAKDVRVENSQPAGVFDAASIEAVRRWTFSPALKDGKPVQGWVRVPIDFQAPPPVQAPPVPLGIDENAYDWSVVDVDVADISEMECDAIRTDAQPPRQIYCGNRKAALRQ